jgi:uncharacterized protein YcsI (UPF0317 family)
MSGGIQESGGTTTTPAEFRLLVRTGDWTGPTTQVLREYAQANLVVLPRENAFDFLLFCQRNPQACPLLAVTDPGDPRPTGIAREADLRTDLPKYRVFERGGLVDEPSDISSLWRDDLVAFLFGAGIGFEHELDRAEVHYRRYGAYRTSIPCVSAGPFSGTMIVVILACPSSADAVRAVQISSRYPAFHGAPLHVGDPGSIGVNDLGKPDSFFPERAPMRPPEPHEIVMSWGCGVTPQDVAIKSNIPFMITHCPGHFFVTDRRVAELSII